MITDFNDSWQFSSDKGETWTQVTLPHDAQMTLARSADARGGSATGYYPGGDFLYRREFDLSKEEAASHVLFNFGGVYRNAEVSINGIKAGGCCYGYLPFTVVADGLVKEGRNFIGVSCSNALQPDSRWYSGAGIYRPVTMQIQGKERIVPGSVRIKTMSIDDESGKAVLHIGAMTEPKEAKKRLKITVSREPAGGVWEESEKEKREVIAKMTGTGYITIPDAKRWSADTPDLYHITIVLPEEKKGTGNNKGDGKEMPRMAEEEKGKPAEQKNAETVSSGAALPVTASLKDPKKESCAGKPKRKELDRAELNFGLRKIYSDPDGFYINDERVLFRGGCIHSDNGVVGAREYRETAWRRIRMLKQYGFNAIRSAHNPISEELMDACDHLGMYIIDETWDMWYRKKNKYDYANDFPKHYREDIAAVVRKDYNHPSVVLYSIGNEVSEPAEVRGKSLGREMTTLFHQLDPERPVTGGFNLMIIARSAQGKDIYDSEGKRKSDADDKKKGMNSTMFNLMTSFVGTGMNKAANGKKTDEVTRPILDMVDVAGYNYASGRYKNEKKLHPERLIIGSETFPQDIAKNWAMIKEYPWVAGDFMWTAWDYLGEAGIGAWTVSPDAKRFDKPYPWLLADTGALDITGSPNGEAFLAQSVWTGKTALSVRPVNEDSGKLIKAAWRGTNAILSWSFAGCEGKKAVAEVYTGAPYAELYLNGKRIGRKKVKENRALFTLRYEQGELKGVGVDEKGSPWGEEGMQECSLKSAEKDLCIRVIPEEDAGGDREKKEGAKRKEGAGPAFRKGAVVFLDIGIQDGNGVTESNRDRKIRLFVDGAELCGFGSANPRTTERFDSGEYTTWRGKALAVIRIPDDALSGAAITVRAEDVTEDKMTLPEGKAVIFVR